MTLPAIGVASQVAKDLEHLQMLCEDKRRYKEEITFWYEFETTPRTRYLNDLLRSAAAELELKYSSSTKGRFKKTHKYSFVGEARYIKVMVETIQAWS